MIDDVPTPSQLYADAVADLCLRLPAPTRADRNALAETFDRHYRTHRAALSQGENDADRFGAAVFAIGLLALGRLDVLDDALSMPATRGAVGRLGGIFGAMFPLPEALRGDPAAQAHYLRDHRSRFRFDAAAGLYRQHDLPPG